MIETPTRDCGSTENDGKGVLSRSLPMAYHFLPVSGGDVTFALADLDHNGWKDALLSTWFRAK